MKGVSEGRVGEGGMDGCSIGIEVVAIDVLLETVVTIGRSHVCPLGWSGDLKWGWGHARGVVFVIGVYGCVA